MWEAALSLGVMGLFIGVILALAANKFKVEVDPRIPEIQAILPGANCGACGFPGCVGLAEAICAGNASCAACKVGGDSVAKMIADLMGVSAESDAPQVAVVYCQGDCEKATGKAVYDGVTECKALHALGGDKDCPFGCLGLGSCVRACPFGAMHMNDLGLPVVDRDKCVGCGVCVQACPRGVIGLAPKDKIVHILCRSYDRGPAVRKYCSAGCIACQLCVRTCPEKAISMDKGFLAKIDYDLCTNCGACVAKCPAKTIVSYAKENQNVAS